MPTNIEILELKLEEFSKEKVTSLKQEKLKEFSDEVADLLEKIKKDQEIAEADKTAAETAKAQAEADKTAAETAKAQAEADKTAAETAAETAKAQAETANAQAEAAETAKAQAEADKTAAETAKAQAETAKAQAEAAETAKAQAETDKENIFKNHVNELNSKLLEIERLNKVISEDNIPKSKLDDIVNERMIKLYSHTLKCSEELSEENSNLKNTIKDRDTELQNLDGKLKDLDFLNQKIQDLQSQPRGIVSGGQTQIVEEDQYLYDALNSPRRRNNAYMLLWRREKEYALKDKKCKMPEHWCSTPQERVEIINKLKKYGLTKNPILKPNI